MNKMEFPWIIKKKIGHNGATINPSSPICLVIESDRQFSMCETIVIS